MVRFFFIYFPSNFGPISIDLGKKWSNFIRFGSISTHFCSNINQRSFVCRRRVCWIPSSHARVWLRVDFIFVLASHIISYNLNNGGMRVCYNFVRNTNVEHFIGSLWFAMKCFLVKLSQWEPEQSAIKANNKVKITKNKKIRRIHTFRIQPNNEIDFEMSLSAHYSAWHQLHQPLAIDLCRSLPIFATICHHLCYHSLQWPSKWPKNGHEMTLNDLKMTWTYEGMDRCTSKTIQINRKIHIFGFLSFRWRILKH